MTTVAKVLDSLKKKGSEQTRKTFARHGIDLPMYGVKVADLRVIAKGIRGDQDLAVELFDTGNYDAMYLAGMVADGAKMSKRQLDDWAKAVPCEAVCSYVVPWLAVESPYARDLALKWMNSRQPSVAIAGWATYAGIVATTPDDELDLAEIQGLLDRVVENIATAPNKVRYLMNSFVISVGSYVKPLLIQAKAAAKELGVVSVDMGDTACKVPQATEYIKKVESMGRVGKKRKTMRC